MKEEIQVGKAHYEFSRYMDKSRWTSVWHQLDEVISLNPLNVLEIGPGPGIFKQAATLFGIKVETLDLDPDLKPDYVGSATALPFAEASYEVVCAFQMLEHLPYEKAMRAFAEMVRVSRRCVVVSLPDARPVWPYRLHIPKLGALSFLFPRPILTLREHVFDGEHYWEVNKNGYTLPRIIHNFEKMCPLVKTYRVFEAPYHRFFVFKQCRDKI